MLQDFTPFPEPYNPPMDKKSVRLRELAAEISFIRMDMDELQKRIGALQWQQIKLKEAET